jgi:predicted FMN-binding regulatory protein PaiB
MIPGRFEAMVGGIVGFEMTVERLEGVRELSQNQPAEAQDRLSYVLTALGGEDATAPARLKTDG